MKRLWHKVQTVGCMLFVMVTSWAWLVPMAWLLRLSGGDQDRKRQRYHETLCRYFRWCACHIPGVTTAVSNPHGETFARPAVVIANHQSHLDLLCLLMLTPRVVALTNRWVWRNPVYGPVIHYAEFYPVADGIDDGMPQFESLVRRGYSIIVFPEGTRSVDCRVGRFHQGAFHLARRLGLDIVPVYLDGPGRVLPKTDMTLHPGTLSVEVGRRVAATDTSMGADERSQTRAWHRHYVARFAAPDHNV